MKRDPWMKFYPADWANDIKLQACSLAAQGLLVNLMCLMHQSERYGYLLINGVTPPNKALYKLLRLHHNALNKPLNELLKNGVLKKDGDVIFSPRMVRDKELREKKREAGKKGGNPTLLNQKDNMDLKPICQKSDVRSQKKNMGDGNTISLSSCPLDGIVELYHKLCPLMPKVRTKKAGSPLGKRIRARWKEHPNREWWRRYLEFCGQSRFLSGRTKEEFIADLFWLTGPINMEKILNGRYHRDPATRRVSEKTAKTLENLKGFVGEGEDEK